MNIFVCFLNFSELGQKKVYSAYLIFQILFLCIDMLGTSGKIFICSKLSVYSSGSFLGKLLGFFCTLTEVTVLERK